MSGFTHTHEKSNVTSFDQSVTIDLSDLWVCDMYDVGELISGQNVQVTSI